MSARLLSRAGLSSELVEQLKRHRVETCRDLLSLSPVEVMHAAGLSFRRASELLLEVSRLVAPPVTTALELWEKKHSFFPTSLPPLDRLLRGGLPRGALTEITGPSGCGKTQMCLMLSVLATMPQSEGGLDSGVVYIDTEASFSAERLVEIAQNRYPQYFSSRDKVLHMAGRVHVFRELTCQDVLTRLDRLEEDVISSGAGLIVLDSVASVVRKEMDTALPGNLLHRSNMLSHEASTLKYLAHHFNIPVVLTNQITTHGGGAQGDSGLVTAALGNSWSHSVNTRLIVQYLDSHRRQILIAKSPLAPFAKLDYTIEREGLCVDGEEEGGPRGPRGTLYQGTDPGLQPIRVRTDFSRTSTSDQMDPTL